MGAKAGIDKEGLYPLLARLGPAVELVGDPAFYRELLGVLGSRLGADLAMVMRYSQHDAPEYLLHDGLLAEHMELYLRGLYRVDPIYRLCRAKLGHGVKDLTEVSTPAERAGDYFNIFLRLTGMSDDLAILLPIDEQQSIGLVYERKLRFSRREIVEMKGLFPLIESLHRLHQKSIRERLAAGIKQVAAIDGVVRLRNAPGLPPIDFKAALDEFLQERFTPRERDIVRLVLFGYPSAKIGERLKLSVNTIKNHKKRLYRKLDITTERELFLNFVSFLFQDS
ncbi:MAG: LuxR C-terminal-related transcriptional regulator [Parvibaculaceae bacterium]